MLKCPTQHEHICLHTPPPLPHGPPAAATMFMEQLIVYSTRPPPRRGRPRPLLKASPTVTGWGRTGITSFHQLLPARRRLRRGLHQTRRSAAGPPPIPSPLFSHKETRVPPSLLLFPPSSSLPPSQNFPPPEGKEKPKVDTKLELIIPTCLRPPPPSPRWG